MDYSTLNNLEFVLPNLNKSRKIKGALVHLPGELDIKKEETKEYIMVFFRTDPSAFLDSM